jgi:hypothetical protein
MSILCNALNLTGQDEEELHQEWPSPGLSLPAPPFLQLPADSNGRIHVRFAVCGLVTERACFS